MNKNNFNFLIFVMALIVLIPTSRVSAQVITEETISTDTIDVFKKEDVRASHERKTKWASFGSLILPGLGHQMIGENKKAMFYFAMETFLVFSAVWCERNTTKLYTDSRNFAAQYAHTSNSKKADDEFWKLIGNESFRSSDEYNYVMELNGTFDKKYVLPEDRWKWEDDSYQKTYRDMQSDATRYHVVSTFFIAGLILDRVVSFIDVRISARRRSFDATDKTVSIHPYYSVQTKQVGIALNSQF